MNVLITGGTSGIGKCLVERFTREEFNVTFVGRNKERGSEVAKNTGATFIEADISNVEGCQIVFDEFYKDYKNCDVLINNAGLWTQGPLVQAHLAEIQDVLAINTLAPIILTRLFLERIESEVDKKNQNSARIFFVNSMAGLNAKADRSVYFASKWAITGFARSLSMELSPKNIAVTNVCPGYINTELFDNGGYPRDSSDALDPNAVADSIFYAATLPDGVQVGEITIKPTKYI